MNRKANGYGSPRKPLQNRRGNTVLSVTKRRPSLVINRQTSRILKSHTRPVMSVDSKTQRGNIQVVVRVRPENAHECVSAHRTVIHAVDENLIVFDPEEELDDFYYHGKKQQSTVFKRNRNIKYSFDRVYGTLATNREIYEGTIKLSLDTLLGGFNCTVFAYGATGSGKTYTMLGTGDSNPGLTFLTLVDLYDRLRAMESEFEHSVSVSYLEVYNETVYDLMNTEVKGPVLTILEDENGISVANLTNKIPRDEEELFQLLADGNSRRTQHPTDQNAESSRSHAVFQVSVNLRARYTELSKSIRRSKLVMVDLAGSERGSATGYSGDRFREGASINKSLLALGNCINALAGGKSHIPYRDSKLTRLLKDSLGGKCKTIIIANVSPSSNSYDDTHNTLKYANRAKNIVFNVRKNEVIVNARVTEYKKVVEEMQSRIIKITADNLMLAEENNKLKSKCTCSQGKLITDDSNGTDSMESDVETPTTNFSKLKRHYSEALCKLEGTEYKLELKKTRLHCIDSVTDAGAAKGVERMKRQVEKLELQKEALANRSVSTNSDIVNELNTAALQDTVPISKAELAHLKSLEEKLERSTVNHQEEKREALRTEHLLGRSMKFVKTIYQLCQIHNHSTKVQHEEYNALRAEYFGHNNVRWADQDQDNLYKSTGSSDLNATYTTLPSNS